MAAHLDRIAGETHDVRHDRPGGRIGEYQPRRLTCFTEACRGDTLVHQPWMDDAHWNDAVGLFMVVHPVDVVRPSDRRWPTLRWDGYRFSLEPTSQPRTAHPGAQVAPPAPNG